MSSTKFVFTLSGLAIALLPAGSAVGSTSAGSARATGPIAFVSGVNYELWVTSLNGLVQRPLSFGNQGVSDLAWSPDGRRIAFTGSGLQVVDADGSQRRRLTEGTVAIGFSWSPDGRRLVYTGFDKGSPQIFVVDVDGGAPRRLAPAARAPVSPSWSPRGGTIAFATAHVDGGPIHAVNADGSGLRALTKGGDDSFPSWSPDGRWVLFERYSCPTRSSCGHAIHVVRADGAMPRRLIHVPSDPGGGGLASAWSPDGRRIAFERPRGGLLGGEIVVMGADGKRVRRLTAGQRGASDPAWSPDSRRIVYESGASIFVMNADGTGKRRLVEFGRIPAWQPRP